MYNLELNIGLNVGNTEPTNQLILTHNTLAEYFSFKFSNFRIESGSWASEEGIIEERVLIREVNVGQMTKFAIHIILETMCETLNQDAIAYKLNGIGDIAYNSSYKGERYQFNEEYFRSFSEVKVEKS